MAISFTEDQQRVIDTHGCNLLVSAAAGSGKTAVLVERIVKMVSDRAHPVDIDRLLVVTFTNAAAAEMRERISRALNDKLAADPENEHLQRQATLLHNAQITTIDSFCLFVIRNQFYTIGLDPGFRIAEEGERKLLIKDVLDQVLEDGYAKGEPSFLKCMEYFSVGSRDSAVEEVVMRLYDFAMSNPFPEKWLEERKKDYRLPPLAQSSVQEGEGMPQQDAVRFEDIPWVAFFMTQARLILEGCIARLGDAIAICEEPDAPYHYGRLLEQEKELAEALLCKCGQDYEAIYTAFETMKFDRLPSRKDDTISPVKRELVKDIRNGVKETLLNLRERYFFQTREQIVAQMEACGEAVDALIDLVLAFKAAFDDKKRDKNLLDFDDIEHFALAILTKTDGRGNCVPTETALEYRSHFHEILIDEYQDSNLVQEYLLSCISGEDEGRYNRFMVGDVKQSIYKFRLARPALFLDKYESYSDAGDRVKISLRQNFRSRYEILNSTNAVFEQLMGREVGGIVYDEQAALYQGAQYPESVGNETELLLFKTEEKPEEISVKEQEAYGVAVRIKQLMQDFKVTDKETGILRPVAYKDIVILLRTASGWDEVFKKVLEREGIPVHMTSRTGYFAAGEVQELLHFLRVLDNPLQDIPFYGVLHSSLGGFSEEEIALIRAAYPKKKYLYDAFVLCGEEGNREESVAAYGTRREGEEARPDGQLAFDRELIAKIKDFHARIERCRNLAVYLSVHELLQTILRETDYLNYVAALPEGNKRRANVEMLLVKAAEYEKTSYFGLYHFLRYMEQLEKYEVDYGEAGLQDENADVVRIMSIHKSKGLEFPVCFVCGLAKGFQKKDSAAHMVADVDAGIGVDYVNPQMRIRSRNLRRNVIADKVQLDNLAEELRILYVAMTRAKEKLILTGTMKSAEKKMASLVPIQKKKEVLLPYGVLISCSGFLDMILAALARNKSMDEVYTYCGYEPGRRSVLYDKDMSIRVTLGGWGETVAESVEERIEKERAKERLVRSDNERDVDHELMIQMSEKFSYQYPHWNLRDLYTKTTVSELKKAGMKEEADFAFELYEQEPVVPYLPKFLKEEERISGSQRGSAFHKVMELFDFTELTEEVKSNKGAVRELLERQMKAKKEEGRLSEEDYEAVSIPKIITFLQSDAALRMGRAAREGKLYKEQPFVLGLPASRLKSAFPAAETVLIQGIIDVFFEEDDRIVVLDYKTDAVDTPEELVKRYRIQLDYYAEALERMFVGEGGRHKQVREKIIYSFKLGKEILLGV